MPMLGPFSACLEVLFTEQGGTTSDRLRRAAEAGFGAVEIWHWRNKDLASLRDALDETSVRMTSMILEPQLPLVDAVAGDQIERAVRESAAAARGLGAVKLIVVSGDALRDVPRERQHERLRRNLERAAQVAGEEGVVLILEPLNSRVDHVGHYLDTTVEGLDLVRAVDHPSLRLLYDLYHSIVMDEDTAAVLKGRVDMVAHVHLADAPGRHEPGTGRADLEDRLGWLRRQGYHGPVGLEFWATEDTGKALGSLQERMGPLA
jgi:hydroxypyruvate isomerase